MYYCFIFKISSFLKLVFFPEVLYHTNNKTHASLFGFKCVKTSEHIKQEGKFLLLLSCSEPDFTKKKNIVSLLSISLAHVLESYLASSPTRHIYFLLKLDFVAAVG